jgi:hypothetical protein
MQARSSVIRIHTEMHTPLYRIRNGRLPNPARTHDLE